MLLISAANSSGVQPEPTPTLSRPPERWSIVAISTRGPGPRRPDGSGAALHRRRPGRDRCYFFFPLLDFFDFLLFFATQITPPPHSSKSTTR